MPERLVVAGDDDGGAAANLLDTLDGEAEGGEGVDGGTVAAPVVALVCRGGHVVTIQHRGAVCVRLFFFPVSPGGGTAGTRQNVR